MENLMKDVEIIFKKMVFNREKNYHAYYTLVDALKSALEIIIGEIREEYESYLVSKGRPIVNRTEKYITSYQKEEVLDKKEYQQYIKNTIAKIENEIEKLEEFKTGLLNGEDFKSYYRMLNSYQKLNGIKKYLKKYED